MKTIKILIAALTLSTQFLFAQTDTSYCNYLIKGEPLFLFNQGIRIDFDMRMKNPTQWMTLSPTFYVNYETSSQIYTDRYNKMWGLGFDWELKQFMNNAAKPCGFYLSPGATVQFFQINLSQSIWTNTVENNTNLILPEYKVYNQQIYKLGVNALIGYQNFFSPSMYYDLYFGVGVRYSIYQSPYTIVKYNNNYYDFGYTGIMMVGGVRIGIGW